MALAHPIHPKSAFAIELRAKRAEGKAEGKAEGLEDKVMIIQRMLDENFNWDMITKLTSVTEAEYPALLQQVKSTAI